MARARERDADRGVPSVPCNDALLTGASSLVSIRDTCSSAHRQAQRRRADLLHSQASANAVAARGLASQTQREPRVLVPLRWRVRRWPADKASTRDPALERRASAGAAILSRPLNAFESIASQMRHLLEQAVCRR